MAPQTAAETALFWIRQGREPIPVPYRSKAPTLKGWQTLRITEDSLHNYFHGALQNIGLLLGEPSGGLVDIDLDCAEAVASARYFFPDTKSFGRKSNPNSRTQSKWFLSSFIKV